MDKETIKRLNRIIDSTVTTNIPMDYIKSFIITDLDGDEVTLSKEDFQEFIEEFEDEFELPFEVSFILDYKKIRKNIKLITDKILEEG